MKHRGASTAEDGPACAASRRLSDAKYEKLLKDGKGQDCADDDEKYESGRKQKNIGRRDWTRTNDPHHVKVVL